MIPDYFTATGTDPATTPPAPHDEWHDLLAYRAFMQHRRTASTRAHRVGVDVWRASTGEHLWRSWPAEAGETVGDWVEREHGQTLHDHDTGPWAVPGIERIERWPIPTPEALEPSPPMTMPTLRAALVTVCAIVAGSDALRAVPTGTMLKSFRYGVQRRPWAVPELDIACRALILPAPPLHVIQRGFLPGVTWRATLQDKTTGEAIEQRAFHAPADAPPRVLSAGARRALGLTGLPSQRLAGALTWRLTGRDEDFVIRREDDGE